LDAIAQQLEGIDEHQHIWPEMQDSRFDGARSSRAADVQPLTINSN
jgi:hypothetical protein